MNDHIVPVIIDGLDIVDNPETVFGLNQPSDGLPTWSAQGATDDHCALAAGSSMRAFRTWKLTTPSERMRLFQKLGETISQNATAFQKVIQEELLCPEAVAKAHIVDCLDLAEKLSCLLGSGVLDPIQPEVQNADAHAIVYKQPLGVILGIAPWNASSILGLRAVAAPVAAGNCAILKGSELSPRTHYFVADLFRLAGFPPGVVNFLVHRPSDGAAIYETLISRPEIRKCNFTGSTAVGRHIAMRAANHLKPVLLELGGKNFALVLEDADLDKATTMVLMGAFLNTGQICMSTDIVLVPSQLQEQFYLHLERKLDALSSALVRKHVHPQASKRITSLLQDAQSKGATIVSASNDGNSRFEAGRIIKGLSKDMNFWEEESFGPIFGVATYDSVDEAIGWINECQYGLSSAIFTTSHHASLKVAQKLEVGAVHVNSMTVHDEACLPHGGYKNSGWGRFGGHWALEEFVQTQTVILNP